jgi:RNA polymerase sigma-70 factor (ECF subfamily)
VNLDDSAMEISDPQGEILAFDQSLEAVLGRTRLEEIDELLTDDQRKTIRLFFFEGYTLEEIAESLGQPIGNVRHHYYRGLERMRKHILKKKLRSDWAI